MLNAERSMPAVVARARFVFCLISSQVAWGTLPGGAALIPAAHVLESCRIEVVDKQNGWPVPLVQLRTTHSVIFVTDNAGIIALDAPELMGRETWFDVLGHGYEAPKDGFGIRGVRLTPQPGKSLRVEVTRVIVAKRLGRSTGGGI